MCAAMRNVVFLLIALCLAPAWAQSDPLFEAVAAGRIEEVERLIGAGAAVNARNEDAETLLYVAAEKGHAEIVRFLLDRGAEVNRANRDGERPLFWAAAAGRGRAAPRSTPWTITATARCTAPSTEGTMRRH